MKKKQLYLLMLLCIWLSGDLLAQLEIIKEYDVDFIRSSSSNLDWHDQQIDQIDAGYIIGGPKDFNNSMGVNSDPVLFDINEQGDLLGLSKRYRLDGTNEFHMHVTTINPGSTQPSVLPGFLLSGKTQEANDVKNFLIRTNNLGDIIWQRKFDIKDGVNYTEIDIAEVKQVSSGKIILVGHFSAVGNPYTNPMRTVVMRINAVDGTVEWHRTYESGYVSDGGTAFPDLRTTGIIEDTPGRYIIFGKSVIGSDGYILEMQDGFAGPSGVQLRRIDLINFQDITSVVTDGNDFIIAGNRTVASNREIFAFRTSNSLSTPESLDNASGFANTYLTGPFAGLAHLDNSNSQLTFFCEINGSTAILVTNPTGTPLNQRIGYSTEISRSVNGFVTSSNAHALNKYDVSGFNDLLRFTSYSLLGNTCEDGTLSANPGITEVSISPTDFVPLNNPLRFHDVEVLVVDFIVNVTEICSECEHVSIPESITTTTGDNILCEGSTIELTAPAGYSSYVWGYDGSTSNTLTITEGGTYIVYLTDANGCEVTQTITIESEHPPFIGTTNPDAICEGECVDLTATADFYPISWYAPGGVLIGTTSGPFDPINVCPSVPTTYTAVTTDPLTGCTNSADVLVMVEAIPKVTTTLPLDVGCNCDPIQVGSYDTADEEMDWTNGFFSPLGAGGTYEPIPSYIDVQTLGALDVYTFYPCDNGEGDYPLTYTYTTAVCTTSVTGTISVSNMPTVEIDGVTDLCETGSTTLTAIVGGTSETMDIQWTKVGVTFVLGIGTTLNVTSTGTYIVTVTNPDHPECTASATITVTDDGTWHKTTQNTTGTEVVNDVVTDATGNVYVTGTFSGSTEIDGGTNPNITITTAIPGYTGMFVAKYNDCGTLLWVAQTDGSQSNTGESLTLDEVNGMVYVTGNLISNTTFYSSVSAGSLCAPGSGDTETIGSSYGSNSSGYIAQYNMATGCLYFAEIVEIDYTNDFRTITTDEATGTIFVGGSHSDVASSSSEYYAFIRKYQPLTGAGISNVLNPPIWTILDNVQTSGSYNVINDLDYDETNDWIHAVGTFFQYVNLFNGTVASESNFAALSDAFLATYRDLGASNTLLDLRKGNASGNSNMTGEGVSESPVNDFVFLTGSYDRSVNNPYMLAPAGAASLPSFYSPATTNAYMIGLRNLPSPSTAWSSYANPNAAVGSVNGKDVVAHQNRVYFLNEFTNTNMINSSSCTPAAFTGVGGGSSRIGIYKYTQNGVCQWVNYSESTTSSDDHNATSITASPLDVCFAVGDYEGGLSYNLGAPWSGDLTMTGTPGGYNGHILRIQNASGAMERTASDADDITTLEGSEAAFIVLPNPANTHVKLKWSRELDALTSVQITDITGKVILKDKASGSEFTWETMNVPNGVYLINVIQGSQLTTEKVIIQH